MCHIELFKIQLITNADLHHLACPGETNGSKWNPKGGMLPYTTSSQILNSSHDLAVDLFGIR